MKNKKAFCLGIGAAAALIVFVIFTVLVKTVDVQDIGPMWSKIGFATLNAKVSLAIGASAFWEKFTEVLGLVALVVGGCFGVLGLVQLIKGRSLKAVDADIYVLGCFYVLLGVVYVLFEKLVINYRPVLEDGELAASYPSSHTVLIVGIFVTSILQLSRRMTRNKANKPIRIILGLLTVAAVYGRLAAGVHWFTDIVGGVLLAVALILVYCTGCELVKQK